MRRRSAYRVAAMAAALVAAATGCTGAPSATPSSITDASAPPVHEPTAWELELGAVEDDGSRSVESALRLFAMAFGPVPGVETPGDAGEILSGSPAVRAIRAHMDDLTEEQRAAVEARLTVPEDALLVEVPAASAARSAVSPWVPGEVGAPKLASLSDLVAPGDRALPKGAGEGLAAVDQTLVNEVASIVTEGRSALARKWTDFPGGVPVFIDEQPASVLTWWEATGGSAGFQCRIMISGTGVDAGRETLAFSLYHELFHCAQAWRVDLDTGGIPPWVWEASARFFAHDTIGFRADPAWITYMTEPETSLFERGYDAIGFWGHVGYALGVDVYQAMEAALAEGSNAQRFVAAGADAPKFVDTWASGLTSMIVPFGPAWRTDGPGLSPALSAPRENVHIRAGDTLSIGRAAYTNHDYVIQVDTDLVRFEVEGYARLGDGSVDTTDLGSATFCVTDRGCEPCPDDPAPRQLTRLSTISLLAVSGGTDGTIGKVFGQAAEPCPTPSPSPTPEPSDEDEFCRRYEALLEWTRQYAGTDYELSQPWAAEIARYNEEDLRPYAPDHLVDEVDLFIRVYGAYARVPEPANVPFVGPEAAQLGTALKAVHDYCGIPFG